MAAFGSLRSIVQASPALPASSCRHLQVRCPLQMCWWSLIWHCAGGGGGCIANVLADALLHWYVGMVSDNILSGSSANGIVTILSGEALGSWSCCTSLLTGDVNH